MDRREFLRNAAAFGTAAAVRRPASAQIVRPATGPLRVYPRNPRYFMDGSGRPIFLTGAHTWANLQDTGTAPIPTFNWQAYLDISSAHNPTLSRFGGWHASACAPWTRPQTH